MASAVSVVFGLLLLVLLAAGGALLVKFWLKPGSDVWIVAGAAAGAIFAMLILNVYGLPI